jgi:hypothetical protein
MATMQEPTTMLTLCDEDARWVATAVTVLCRILQGIPSAYRVAKPLPAGKTCYGKSRRRQRMISFLLRP